MLLRLAYLAATNTLALLRLLPMSNRDKDIEILALRDQLLVLQRQVGKPTFTDADRAVLAGLLHHLPVDKLRHLLLARPDRILRWHRDLLKRRHAATCVPKRRGRTLTPGCPPTRPTRRDPARIPTCRLTRPDNISGTRTVGLVTACRRRESKVVAGRFERA